ncbi:MAG: glycerol-3-phosphate dehydrogenase [Sphingomonadales bacterium]|jgi:glycerol-3-phosphate dehydrogenase|nr:glycerol-3-phosphate dehydrogenase [Sphingomonadales bacterium]
MDSFDLLIIGGGINGAAIARDAAGRGLEVLLVEKDDLAAHTSSASSKLIHGGLRYLEQYDFRLVREALHEREILLRTAPHIVRPLMFVLPDPPGGRPFWLIRAGLLLYDLLAGRGTLPRSKAVGKRDKLLGAPLRPGFRLATYWDAWVDDARLVALNALDAAERGAEIATRTELVSARREGDVWTAALSGGRTVRAAMIVNAAGPWVAETLKGRLGADTASGVRLVKGSHILVPGLWQGDQAYILQQADGRVVFALPYGGASLIGTTDVPVACPEEAVISSEEIAYLCAAANAYFVQQTAPGDVLWSYAGVRSLHDDGAPEAKDVSRDYRLELDGAPGPKLLSVFGGKITTARALALEALDALGVGGLKFTALAPLPGGNVTAAFNQRLDALAAWLPAPLLRRLASAYGTRIDGLLGDADKLAGLGRHFGAGLYEAEVRYLIDVEFARTAEDILWRRTKLGLAMTKAEQAGLARWLKALPLDGGGLGGGERQ